MKYWDLINVGGKTSTPTSDPQTQEVVKYVPVDTTVPEEIADNMKKILEFMEDLKNKNVEAPEGFEDTELDSDEILDVVSTLVEYHDKYFQLTPLSEELSKSFVWNLPRSIYEAHKKLRLMDEPDQLDPIYWFYSLCLADPEYMMATWVVSAYNAFTDDEYDRVDMLNKIYHEDNGIPLGDSSEEDDNEDEFIVEEAGNVYPEESNDHDEEINDEEVIDDSNTEDVDVVEEPTGSDDESEDTDTDESEVSDDTEGTEVTVEDEDVEEVDEEVTDATVNALLDSLRIDGSGNAEFNGPNAEEYENTNPDELVMDVTETKDIEIFKAD